MADGKQDTYEGKSVLHFENLTIQGQKKGDGWSKPATVDIYQRAKVPGGWLIRYTLVDRGGLTFIPDPYHKWDGGDWNG